MDHDHIDTHVTADNSGTPSPYRVYLALRRSHPEAEAVPDVEAALHQAEQAAAERRIHVGNVLMLFEFGCIEYSEALELILEERGR